MSIGLIFTTEFISGGDYIEKYLFKNAFIMTKLHINWWTYAELYMEFTYEVYGLSHAQLLLS